MLLTGRRFVYTVFVVILLSPIGIAQSKPSAPSNLTCEYLTDPFGIEARQPRLSWHVNDSRRGATQSAYRIIVATDLDRLLPSQADAWDSGKVESDRSIQIDYAGKPLQSSTRYYWSVQTWDADGKPSPVSPPAFWEMGLLDPSDWKAQWIGLGDPLPPNVSRHVGYHSEIAHSAETEKWVTLDLGTIHTLDTIQLFPCQPFDYSKSPGFLFPVRFKIEVSTQADFQTSKTITDHSNRDYENPSGKVQTFRFEPQSCRFVRLTVTKLALRDADNYAFALAELRTLFNNVEIPTPGKALALDTIESDDWSLKHLNDGVTETRQRTYSPPGPAHTYRKAFTLPSPIEKATVHVSALGLYELHINGKRVGKNLLAPEWTDYHTRIQYQTYDVTPLLKKGKNAVAALVGEGWYAGMVGLLERLPYGPQLGLIAQLEIECKDGTTHLITTDSSWKGTKDGPITGNDIVRGETYDARKEIPGWDTPDFDNRAWRAVVLITGVKGKLVSQPNEAIQITQELKPIERTEPRPGVYVFDMGQNMVGCCRLKAKGQAGTFIQLRHAERLNPDGTVYTDNLRGDFQKIRYIAKDNREAVIQPYFSYQGFRYVEVTGLSSQPPLDALIGLVFHSAAPVTGRFECSDSFINQLIQNILWTQRGNMHSTPTDCPQRDERSGWMGDAQAFSQTACFNMNMAAFYTKWLKDVRDAQADDGRFSDISPNPLKHRNKFLAAPAWADAGIIVPWRAYVNYADTRILERHYDAAKRWVEYVHRKSPDLIWAEGRGNDYGDWLNGDRLILDGWPKKGADTPREILATAFFAHSTELLSK